MTWQLVVVNPDGSAIGELTAATSRKFIWNKDDSSSITWTIDGKQSLVPDEVTTDVILYRDGTPWFRGRTGASTDTLDGTTHSVTMSAVDYRGLLARRFIWTTTNISTGTLSGTTWTISAVDQAEIAWSLIDGIQNTPDAFDGSTTESTFNISRGTVPDTGVTRDRTFFIGDNVGSLLDDLGRVLFGFDWEIDAGLQFNVFPFPGRGVFVDRVLMYGANVAAVTRTLDTTTYANAQMVTGGQTSAYTPGVAEVDTGSFGPGGRWEAVDSGESVTDTPSAVDVAQGNLTASSEINPTYALTLTPGWWSPNDLWLGDVVRVVINSGRLNVDTTQRITQIEVDLDDDGGETVIVTIGPFNPSLADIVRQNAFLLDRVNTR